ncbi:MAG: class I SAM-dependent methyltransferase [Anaerolineae bacterium]|nr:MAG: class I SAM-dependent methyltransferase [Anaerolineae bacterium]
MDKFTDQQYLVTQQYASDANLSARIALHERFSTNPQGWYAWYFEQISLPPAARILEVGCGSGKLWRENLHRLPAAWDITLSDLSLGMLRSAERNLAAAGERFTFRVHDVQLLPYENATFDALFANHMLYHVPNLERTLLEIQRVLKPGGMLYAATNGERHMAEMDALGMAFAEHIGFTLEEGFTHRNLRFSLENGARQLQPYFSRVERRDYPDSLVVTEARPLAAYLLSTTSAVASLDAAFRKQITRQLEAFMAQKLQENHGAIHIHKATGLFIAQK